MGRSGEDTAFQLALQGTAAECVQGDMADDLAESLVQKQNSTWSWYTGKA